MKNAVCIKQVPAREWQHRLSDSKSWIEERDVSYEMNEPATRMPRRGSSKSADYGIVGNLFEIVPAMVAEP